MEGEEGTNEEEDVAPCHPVHLPPRTATPTLTCTLTCIPTWWCTAAAAVAAQSTAALRDDPKAFAGRRGLDVPPPSDAPNQGVDIKQDAGGPVHDAAQGQRVRVP